MASRRARTAASFRAPLPVATYVVVAAAAQVALIAIWLLIRNRDEVVALYLPGPLTVIQTGVQMFVSGGFLWDVLASGSRIGFAFLISALVGVPLGLLMSAFKPVEAAVEPVVDFVRYIPVPALMPLFVLWAGVGETAKFLVLFFGTCFQLTLLVMDDAEDVPQIQFELARTMGANRYQLLRDILVPAILPQIYDRLRVTLGWCWTYLVIAELIAVDRGVGHAIKEAQRFNAADQLFVCFFVLGFVGLATDYLAKAGHRWLFPYAQKA